MVISLTQEKTLLTLSVCVYAFTLCVYFITKSYQSNTLRSVTTIKSLLEMKYFQRKIKDLMRLRKYFKKIKKKKTLMLTKKVFY